MPARLTSLAAALLAAATALAAAPAVVAAQPDDWGAGPRDPFDKSVVARYKALLAKNPHDAGALAKLQQLYRSYRTFEQLRDEYDAALAKQPDDWALLIVVGRLARAGGDAAAALVRFEAAAKAKADDGALALELGDLYRRAGRAAEARTAFDRALTHASGKPARMKALRALADLALAAADIAGAKAYFEQYIALDPGNVQLRLELGDALAQAGKHDDAIAAYAEAERKLGSDPARRIEVIARIGAAREGKGDDDGAVAEFRRAIKAAPKGYWIIGELTNRIVDVYRRKQQLPALLAEFDAAWSVGSRGYFEWDTLARLHEETGAADQAIAAYKKAVAKSPWELETQRRLIQLLETSGRDDEALAQYEAVVRAAPGEARFQIDLAERYWRRGKPDKALAQAKQLEGRFGGDAGVLSAIADMYMRWGKDALALAAFERLARLEPDEPSHLVALGEQHWLRGDKPKARAVWDRLIARKTAAGYAEHGQVLADHGLTAEGLLSLDKAIQLEPANVEHYKKRAQLRESKRDFADAIADWQKVLGLLKPTDRSQRREAQRRLVQVIVREPAKETSYRTAWQRDFTGKNDTEAGFLLAAYHGKKNQHADRQRVLEKLRALLPDDQDVITDLVKAYRDQRKYDAAVALLEALIVLAPTREREACGQIAEVKTEARQDAEAIAWAQKCLAKTPNDPDAYARLGERYVEMQRIDDAIAAYERTIKLDARNVKARFVLAHLYAQSSQPRRAAELYRAVLRTSTDDEAVARAGREAIDLEEALDSLGELEVVVAPLSFVLAHKPIYRRILVDLYLRYVPRLVERERRGDAEVRRAARAELARVGAHGLKPLLEALHDEKDPAQQRVAVTVLGHLGNRGAAAALVKLARTAPVADPALGVGPAPQPIGTVAPAVEWEVRVEALIAAGRLGDPQTFDDVAPLATHDEVAMREAAVFALGRMADKRALPGLLAALDDRRESVQVLACLGLADAPDAARAVAGLVAVVADPRRHDLARAACAYALGARGATAGAAALATAVADNRGDAQRVAAWALGQLGDVRALEPLLAAYFGRPAGSRRELAWAIARITGSAKAPAALALGTSYPLRSGKFDATARVTELPGALPDLSAPAAGLARHADAVAAGVRRALADDEDDDVLLRVLDDLDAAPDRLALGELGQLDDATAAALATALVAPLAPHVRAGDPRVRAVALSVLAKLGTALADDTLDAQLAAALADAATLVRHAALRAIGVISATRGRLTPALAAALGGALEARGWQDRQTAARTLGELAARLPPGSVDAAGLRRATGDASGYVREAVAVALAGLPGAASVTAAVALSRDPLVPVRLAAIATLRALGGPEAATRLREVAADPAEPDAVRAAAAP